MYSKCEYSRCHEEGKNILAVSLTPKPYLTVSGPYFTKASIPKLSPETDSIKLTGLYHLIYTYGPRKTHFCVLADSETDAKEKIIQKEKDSFGRDFPEDIRALKAHYVSKVLKVYEHE